MSLRVALSKTVWEVQRAKSAFGDNEGWQAGKMLVVFRSPRYCYMKNDKVLLSVQKLSTWFELKERVFSLAGKVRALDGVSFELKQGEAVAIVGESGCGKSTLIKTLLRLHQPTKGEFFLDGTPIHNADKGQLRKYRVKVGYVQQDPYGALPPFMNVRRILEEPLIIHNVPKKKRRSRILEVLKEVGLKQDYLHKFPHMMSGGEQQRVVIARANLLKPKLILADEPVSMLDASVRVGILELFRNLQLSENNTAVLYITHDLSTVRHFSDRIFVMYGGQIVEQAPVQQLMEKPLHPYTQALLRAIPDADAANANEFRDIPLGEPPSLLDPPAGCRFHPLGS